MADNKSWLSGLFSTKSVEDIEIKELKDKLDSVVGEMSDAETYQHKFLDAEPNTYSSPGQFEYGGIDQMVNNAVLQRIYSTETWVYIAVTAIAKTIAELPLKLEKKTKIRRLITNEITGKQEEVEQDHWIDASGEKLFERFQYPNKYCTKTEFMMLLVIDLLTAGEYFIYLDSDEDLSLIASSEFDDDAEAGPWGRLRTLLAANTNIKGMYRIPPALVKPVINEQGYGIEGYLLQSDKGQYVYDCAEIIHVKLPNPLNMHVGLSPLIPAFKPVLLDRFSTEHMIRFYKTGARLGGIIESEKSLGKEQLSRFQRSFENNFTGRHNFHRTLILPPGMSYKQIEQNPAETALLEFCRYNREAILSVYNVPPIKVGILDNANYANAVVQLKIFFTDTIKPYLSFIEDGFNLKNTLMPDTKLFRIEFDLSEVDALKEDFLAIAQAGERMIAAGLSVNEVRKKVWKAGPVKDGDKVKVIEDMDKQSGGFPIFNSAEEGETKDAVSPAPQPDAATIAADHKPTGLSYSQRVAQLTELFMQREKLPLNEAIRRAVEQARAEGFDPTDPDGNSPPDGPQGAPAPDSEESAAPKAAEVPSLDQFISDSLAKLNPNEPVTPEFIAELTELYKQQHGEPVTEKETNLLDAPKVYAFGYTKDRVVAEWKGFINTMDPLIAKRATQVQEFFKKFKSILMNQMGANIKSFGLHKARDNDDVNEILDPSHYEKLIKDYISQVDEVLLDAYKHGYVDTLANVKFDVRNEKALEQLKKYAASKVTGIMDTTRDQMRDVLVAAFDAGVPVTEVAQRLNEKFDQVDSGRAMTIARTETLTAVSIGRQEKREDFKAEFPDKKLKKLWVSAQDELVRDSHVELDGEVRDIDEEFKEGLRFPRDPNGAAEEVINCRCTDITFAEEDQAAVQASLPEKEDEKSLKKKSEIKIHRGENETLAQCVARAIPYLINEGKDQGQAVAIAHSMCELPKGGPGSGRKPEGGSKPKPASNRRRGSIQREQAVSGDKEALEVIKETQKEFDAIKEENPALAKALRFWSTNGYKDVRNLQQGKEKEIAKENLNLAKANTKELESNFDKLPSYEGPVTRELSGVDASKFKAGDTMTMDAHSSFTAKGKWGGGEKASVRLVVPSNKSGKAIWGMSNLAEEMEVVVPKGTSYKIGKIVPGNPSEVHLEEVGGKSAADLSKIINEALNQPLAPRRVV